MGTGSWTNLYTGSLSVFGRSTGYVGGARTTASAPAETALPFVCSSCGERSAFDTECLVCGVPLFDARLAGRLHHEDLALRPAHGLGWPWRTARARLRRHARAVTARVASAPAAATVAAADGLVRLRGRARVVEPVSSVDDGRPVAAWVRARPRVERCACRVGCQALERSLRIERRVGRVLVVTGTGQALLDPELPVWAAGLRAGGAPRCIEDGDAIDVVGRVVAEPTVAHDEGGTYRERPTRLRVAAVEGAVIVASG